MEEVQHTIAVEEGAATQPQEEAKKIRSRVAKPKRRSSKKLERVVMVRSKRKEAIARASAKLGSGRVRVNGIDINAIEQDIYRGIMREPMNLSNITKSMAAKLDISINIRGGGRSAQAQAIRSAIAKAIAEFSDTDTIRKEYMRFDRNLLVDDYRRVEPKKFLGPKARARFQTSYR
ncbi:MAG: 30S ribosomal protein S9 [Candidatus Marsarchaeota archaeon]|jgi:small subunit ribosomal protein S9|nr:30S ribosomal protein S9 [Candidatus Marsarchaeota archaeon]MCL5115013.1 30S ribosomal protein S9 [Candidatus Marsarchaeota archaeon]